MKLMMTIPVPIYMISGYLKNFIIIISFNKFSCRNGFDCQNQITAVNSGMSLDECMHITQEKMSQYLFLSGIKDVSIVGSRSAYQSESKFNKL